MTSGTHNERSRSATESHLNAEMHKGRCLGGTLHEARKALTAEDGRMESLFIAPLVEPFFDDLHHHVVEQGALNFGELTFDVLGHTWPPKRRSTTVEAKEAGNVICPRPRRGSALKVQL